MVEERMGSVEGGAEGRMGLAGWAHLETDQRRRDRHHCTHNHHSRHNQVRHTWQCQEENRLQDSQQDSRQENQQQGRQQQGRQYGRHQRRHQTEVLVERMEKAIVCDVVLEQEIETVLMSFARRVILTETGEFEYRDDGCGGPLQGREELEEEDVVVVGGVEHPIRPPSQFPRCTAAATLRHC